MFLVSFVVNAFYLRAAAGSRRPASLASLAALSVASHVKSAIVAAEVSVRRGLAVNRTAQIQRLDDAPRRQLEVRADQIRE